MHPSTELRLVSETVGLGVFAKTRIPKGTIVYILDPLEIIVKPKSPLLSHPQLGSIIMKYSYIDQRGNRIISWDHAKYVNHSCQPKTMSTGYGFEIALRDIEAGEEITDEYGLLNIETPMICCCGAEKCRKVIRNDDALNHYRAWDKLIKDALQSFKLVDQPLASLLPENIRHKILDFIQNGRSYKSVRALTLKNKAVLNELFPVDTGHLKPARPAWYKNNIFDKI